MVGSRYCWVTFSKIREPKGMGKAIWSIKALSPELIQDVTIINGPFSPEYGDFSGLGVVHIRQRESLPDQFTARLQGGNFDNGRAFLAYSPDAQKIDAYIAYDGSYTDGPFINPGRYRRDSVNANYTRTLDEGQKLGFRLIFGRNDFYSSGQVPLDLVNGGLLDRFGYIDPTDGGQVKLGTFSTYYSKSFANGDTLRSMVSSAGHCLTFTRTSRSSSTIPCTAMLFSNMIGGFSRVPTPNTRMSTSWPESLPPFSPG
jgi:hypothetical protein